MTEIVNAINNTVISGTSSADVINNEGSNVTINAGAGNDEINIGYGERYEYKFVTVNGGAGNDAITGSGISWVLTYADGDGNDYIDVPEAHGLINVTSGTVSDVSFKENDVVIKIGAGEITLANRAESREPIFIRDASGDVAAWYVKRDDENESYQLIKLENDFYVVDDWLYSGVSNTLLSAQYTVGSNEETEERLLERIINVGNDVSIDGNGSDFIEITNLGDRVSIKPEDYCRVINYGSTVTIDAETNANGAEDNINNVGDNVLIKFNGGRIFNIGSNVTVDAVRGEDESEEENTETHKELFSVGENVLVNADGRITVGGSNVSINGSDSNNTIVSEADNATIKMSSGKDVISLSGANNILNYTGVNEYVSDYDTVYGFSETDTIYTASRTDYQGAFHLDDMYLDGSNVIIGEIDNYYKNNLTLVDAIGKKINFYSANNRTELSYNNYGYREYKFNVMFIGADEKQSLNVDSDVDYLVNQSGNSTLTINGNTVHNKSSKVLINIASGNNSIDNRGSYSTINAGTSDGNNSIENSAEHVTINGGYGDDHISNYLARYVKIDAGAGDDHIDNVFVGQYLTIDAGEGNDYIYQNGQNVTINGGAGSDTIRNQGSDVLINGDDGNDYIENYKSNSYVTINSGDGNDTIYDGDYYYGGGSFIEINAGSGNDLINVTGSNTTINGDTGNDVIIAGKNSMIIYNPGDGNDTVTNFGNDDTLKLVFDAITNISIDGQDIIIGVGDGSIRLKDNTDRVINFVDANGELYQSTINNYLYGTNENDTLDNTLSNVRILPYGGDDVISLRGSQQIIDIESGNDTIYGISADDVIHLDWLPDRASVVGNDVIFRDESYSLTLKNAVNVKFKMTAYNSLYMPPAGIDFKNMVDIDDIQNYLGNIVVDNGNSGKTIYNHAENATLKSDGGSDIYNEKSNVVIKTGTGGTNINVHNDYSTISNTTIEASGGNNNIYVDAGAWINDALQIGDNVKIKTGAGNDDLHIDNGTDISVNAGDGDNSIIINENVYVDISRNISVKSGAGNDNINIKYSTDVTADAGAGNDSIENYNRNALIDGGDGDDQIINGGEYDKRFDHVTIRAGSGDDNVELHYAENVTVDGGAGNDTIKSDERADWVSVNGGDGNDYIELHTYGHYDDGFLIVNGGKGDDSINVSGRMLYQYADGDGNDTLSNAPTVLHLTSGTVPDVSINSNGYDNNVILKVGNGSITINDIYYHEHPAFAVKTADNRFAAWYIDYDESHQDQLVKLDNNSFFRDGTLVNAVANIALDADASSLDADNNEYWAAKIYNYADRVTINHTDKNHSVYDINYGSDAVINANSYSGEGIVNYGSRVTINALSDDNDAQIYRVENLFGNNVVINTDAQEIYNTGDNVTINGINSINSSYGGSILNNGGSNVLINEVVSYVDNGTVGIGLINYGNNVTINSAASDDGMVLRGSNQIINYELGDGNDVIVGITSNDTIRINGLFSTVLGATDDDNLENDLIVNVDSGSITLKDAAGLALNIVNSSEIPSADTTASGIEYDPKKPSKLTVKDPFTGIVDASNFSDRITLIDADGSSKPVILKAGVKSTVIEAGSGESTLIGGGKDDKLYGGKGVNTFVYSTGGGKDVVYDYEAQDLISIAGATRDKLIFTDKKDVVTVTFDGDKKSQLTINKTTTTDAITIDLNGETFKYGVLPTGVTFDDNNKKTGLKVDSTAADRVTVNAIDIVSTAKTLDGSDASGSVYLIGNGNKNVIQAGKHVSTLYGGKYNVADKLVGGEGADVFEYSAGDGADVISNFDGATGDIVLLDGVTELKADAFKWSGDKLIATIGNQKLTLEDPQGEVRFVNDSDTTLYVLGYNFPEGAGYNKNKTAVTIGAEASKALMLDIDLSNSAAFVSTVKDVNASAYGGSIGIIGNANDNVLRAGKGGSTLDGGKGTDKLHGGDGADVFVYDGDGADVIYNFDGAKDVIMLPGVKALGSKDVTVSTNKIVAKVGSQKLTLNDLSGRVRFVDEDNNELYAVGVNFSEGAGYNANKTAVTVDGSASDVGSIDLSDGNYLSTVKEINATAYGGSLNLVGNGNANVIRTGSGNATLNGGYDSTKNKATSDKLYGSTVGADVFVWDAFLGGNDQIYNYSAAAGDIISVTGANLKIDKKDFKESGSKVVLSAGGGKLTINDVQDKPVVAVYGDDTIAFGSLAGGISYENNKKLLKVAALFGGTVDADDYASSVVTIDGSTATSDITLIGNKKAKVLIGGAGKTTMIGSTAADNFYAGTGADVIVYTDGDGKDVIHKFDSSTDMIKLVDATIAATDFVEKGNNIVINVGSGSITLKDAPRGTVTVEQEGGNVTYKTLPSNVTYKATKEIVTLTKNFSGTLNAADLGLPVKEVNASAVTVSVNLIGMSTATKLTAGKGGSTLTGGADDDTLIGGNGADIFVTSGGNDLIDKYTAGKDKLQIVGTLNSGKINGSNVELTTSNGTVTIKGVVNKELTLTVDGADQKYKFTKTNNTLDKALITGNAQQPADDYWFLPSDDATDEIGALLNESTTADEAALGSLTMTFEQSTALELTSNVIEKRARRIKK